jgi:hypothetical protein
MSQSFQVTGELIDPQHVTLDQPVPAGPSKVRVTVELLSDEKKPDLREFMEAMWQEQRRRGHVPPTKEEVDAYLNAERDSWDA